MLTPQGPASYRCVNPAQIGVILINDYGYRALDARSPHEHIRCQKGNSLVVVYNNGTVLLQGADTQSPRAIFDGMIARAADQHELPF